MNIQYQDDPAFLNYKNRLYAKYKVDPSKIEAWPNKMIYYVGWSDWADDTNLVSNNRKLMGIVPRNVCYPFYFEGKEIQLTVHSFYSLL